MEESRLYYKIVREPFRSSMAKYMLANEKDNQHLKKKHPFHSHLVSQHCCEKNFSLIT